MSSQRGASPARLVSALRGPLVVVLLYLFLGGVAVLEKGISTLGGDVQESLFGSIGNPVAGLCVGVLATVLVQSSSVTTSTIVGLVGAGVLPVDVAVPIVMGANIGTTVTNTLASVGSIRRPQEFRGAFAAATVHDFFNLLSVAVLLPLELATGFLSNSAEWLSARLLGAGGATYESPLKAAVKLPQSLIVDAWEAVGAEGTFLGVLLIVTGLAMIFAALAFITKNMKVLVADRVERSINTILSRGGGVPAILLGVVITVAVQSSSITTSVLVPMAAAGVLSLRNAYPVTLGANVGTTVTALLASLASQRPEGLTIALVHTLFNVCGILLFYPIPALRSLPVRLAEAMAGAAVKRRRTIAGYVLFAFVVVPFLGTILLR